MLNKFVKEDYNYINRLRVRSFRAHDDIIFEPGNSSVLILGSNGVGKTSILEAISIFSYGRGIRNANFSDMINKNKKGFLIDLDLYLRENFILEYQTSYNKMNKSRKVMINNKEIAAKYSRKTIPMLWIAPYTERIFSGSAMQRRNFIDKLVNIFDSEHSIRLNEYEKNMKQRTKLLKDNIDDNTWIEALEKKLSELSVSICSSRLELLDRLSMQLQKPVDKFPKLEIGFYDSIENNLMKKAAIEIEELLKEKLFANREIDRLLGGSRVGCHKTDLMVNNLQKNLSAELCSSGEQKSILISLVLSAASAFMEYTKKSPIILLDEVFTHLDEKKKVSLLEKLVDLQSQIWITATEKENFFKDKKNFCYHNLTENGLYNVY